jgi:hypothetical protein
MQHTSEKFAFDIRIELVTPSQAPRERNNGEMRQTYGREIINK